MTMIVWQGYCGTGGKPAGNREPQREPKQSEEPVYSTVLSSYATRPLRSSDNRAVEHSEIFEKTHNLSRCQLFAPCEVFVRKELSQFHCSFSNALTSSMSCGRPLAFFITIKSLMFNKGIQTFATCFIDDFLP